MSDKIINDAAMDTIFREARTHNAWDGREISRPLLQAVYDLMKWGATSANSSPARFVFVQSDAAKARLKPHLSDGNVEKTMSSPCCVIIAYDLKFYEKLPELFPHTDARSWFEGNETLIAETAIRNGTLQGAYFMIAARSLGLDCGPMSGFNNAGVNAEFFPNSSTHSNFLCNIGYGNNEGLHPRSPRLDFNDACEIL